MDPRTAYRETQVLGASPTRLVVLLYEQAILDLRRAAEAMGRNDIEGRTKQINHAMLIIGQLHGSLDMARGGEVARNLDRFYTMVCGRLQEAQIRVSPQILDEQINCLLELREAWKEVERVAAQVPAEK